MSFLSKLEGGKAQAKLHMCDAFKGLTVPMVTQYTGTYQKVIGFPFMCIYENT